MKPHWPLTQVEQGIVEHYPPIDELQMYTDSAAVAAQAAAHTQHWPTMMALYDAPEHPRTGPLRCIYFECDGVVSIDEW